MTIYNYYIKSRDDLIFLLAKNNLPVIKKGSKNNEDGLLLDPQALRKLLMAFRIFNTLLEKSLRKSYLGFYRDIALIMDSFESRLTSGYDSHGLVESADDILNVEKTSVGYDFSGFNSFEKTIDNLLGLGGVSRKGRSIEPILQAQRKHELVIYPELSKYVDHYLSRLTVDRKKNPNVLCIGSCFAENLSIALRQNGINVNHVMLHEQLNYPAFIADTVRYAFDIPLVHHDSAMGWIDREVLQKNFIDADWIVLTLGSNILVRDQETGKVIIPHIDDKGISRMKGGGELLTTALRKATIKLEQCSIENNVNEVKAFIDLVHIMNPRAKIMLTLSPVPLVAMYGRQVLLDDCVSKSILRSVMADAVAKNPELIYFPSFELVKWIGPHVPIMTFGADDTNWRHVNREVVNSIVKPVALWMKG